MKVRIILTAKIWHKSAYSLLVTIEWVRLSLRNITTAAIVAFIMLKFRTTRIGLLLKQICQLYTIRQRATVCSFSAEDSHLICF